MQTKMNVLRMVLPVTMLACVLLLSGCGRSDSHDHGTAGPSASGDKPATSNVIVASIFPLQNVIQQLVGDQLQVISLMPAGVNPHDFEPTAQQIAAVSNADMMVMVGLNLDPWALKVAKARKIPVISMAELVGLATPETHDAHAGHDHGHDHKHDHAHDHAGPNNHLWLNLEYTRKMVRELTPILAQRHPAKAEAIKVNSEKLLAELAQLDKELADMLTPLPVKELVTFHNAFDPLAERYGLKVVAHLADIDLAPGGEVRSSDLVQAIEAIRKYKLKVVYAEPQFPDKAVEMIARETGARVLKLDPEGNPNTPEFATYQQMLRTNAKTLVDGQSGR